MSAEKHIRLLSDTVINQIAAGEVVERPASVLKELIENAVDAGATQVDVELVDGGRRKLVVTDNGRGMNRDDALLSIERHATSKIRAADDLVRIGTLGFRGEALAAIASVSRFTLTTRTAEDEAGTEILIDGGRFREVREAGCPVGTSIEVRRLFYNVPARKKFLRAPATELNHARQCFLVHALSRPEVGMTLKVDEKESFRLPAGDDMLHRIGALYGTSLLPSLKPVSLRMHGLKIGGFAADPTVHRRGRGDQLFVVNGRPAAAPLVYHALNRAYGDLIPKGRHAIVFLFLEIDPALVDVNVHPTKREVRFRNGAEVRDLVIEAVREGLRGSGSGADGAKASPAHSAGWTAPAAGRDSKTFSPLPAAGVFRTGELLRTEGAERRASAEEGRQPAQAPADSPAPPWQNARIRGQFGGLYVLLEAEGGLIILDPHAAHERVLYERFMREALEKRVQSQGLLQPVSVELPPRDAEIVARHVSLLVEMGFGVSEFGGAHFMVDALPDYLREGDPGELLLEVARALEAGGGHGGTETWAHEAVARAACRAAVKQRDTLRTGEIQGLLDALTRADMPYTCPHGRPTMIYISRSELDRRFGRAGG
ncbi:DNA mismatch repair endonuclease MutL [Kiritimatiella glycovorans]|uniref:DNA mismatch repair protein MutL n=1 Tax=Kiritimatiella glycovorans TaxID=1307763 RepID=A0A0G3ENI5_9BACT|nr:DNA mismatch repair endonuclease MutL [Kiritimatiella glycovorans]AKJ65709.1 DNA mismatch repair protein MutL [Kiritimatiella glycovorans]